MRGNVILLQISQVLTMARLSPLQRGFVATLEKRVQRGQGPSIWQPDRDPLKWFRKKIVVPQSASWIFWAAPTRTMVTVGSTLRLRPQVERWGPGVRCRDWPDSVTANSAPAPGVEGKEHFLKELQVDYFRGVAVHCGGVCGAMADAPIAHPAKRTDERRSRVDQRAADGHFRLGAGVEPSLTVFGAAFSVRQFVLHQHLGCFV